MRYVMMITTLLAIACGGDSSTNVSATPSAVGTWNLSTVNGTGLPYLLAASGSNKSELTAGTLGIVSGGSYTVSLMVRNTINGSVSTQSVSDAGTYVVTGTAISLRSNVDGSIISGSVAANTLTLSETGGAYVFTR